MTDLNFFEPFVEKKRLEITGLLVLYIVLIVSIVGVACVAAVNQIRIVALQKDLQRQEEFINNPSIVAKVQQLEALEAEISTFRKEINNVRSLEEGISASNIVTTNLLFEISSKLPSGVFISNISVDKSQIRIGGYSKDKASVASFAKGLQTLPIVSDSFVSSIFSAESYYRFDLALSLQEVSADGSAE